MTGTLVERVWAWLHETFPERQVYIRSDGRVQFFTFGPSLQATLAGLLLIFLGWVAFATVNVIFKDRIIAAKDHRYQQMQSAYENRVADLQISYDELNGALVSAEDKFQATTSALQAKQISIMQFLNRKVEVEKTLVSLGNTKAAPPVAAGNDGPASDSLGAASPAALDSDSDSDADSAAVIRQPSAQRPRSPRPARKSSLLEGALRRLASLFTGAPAAAATAPTTTILAQHPALRALSEQTAHVDQLAAAETTLMTQTEAELHGEVAKLEDVMGRTGISPNQFLRKMQANDGVGGPEIPLDSVQIIGVAPGPFETAYLHADAVLDQMNTLLAAIRHIPLAMPVSGAAFERTSGFGARIDPFSGHYAFHPGVDFAGPWGAAVAATAPGIVVFAGNRGSYGNMVEIDHGFGIHTRYGHLSAILVKVGARVAEGTSIGKLGSTGRSTGPHVHYEVWYENVVRNPTKFIEAGHHVF